MLSRDDHVDEREMALLGDRAADVNEEKKVEEKFTPKSSNSRLGILLKRNHELKRPLKQKSNALFQQSTICFSSMTVFFIAASLVYWMGRKYNQTHGLDNIIEDGYDRYLHEPVCNTTDKTCNDYQDIAMPHYIDEGAAPHDHIYPCRFLNDSLPLLCATLLESMCDAENKKSDAVGAGTFMIFCLIVLGSYLSYKIGKKAFDHYTPRAIAALPDEEKAIAAELNPELKSTSTSQLLNIVVRQEKSLSQAQKEISTFCLGSLSPAESEEKGSYTLHHFFQDPCFDRHLLPEIFDFVIPKP